MAKLFNFITLINLVKKTDSKFQAFALQAGKLGFLYGIWEVFFTRIFGGKILLYC